MTSSRDRFRPVGSRERRLRSSRVRRRCRPAVERLEAYRLLSSGPITEFPIPTAGSYPEDITSGPDGNLWFTENNANQVGMIDPTTDIVTEFPLPTPNIDPGEITTGPDGNLWFTENGASQVGMINPTTHVVSEFPLPTADGYAGGIAAGPDGNVWFTEPSADQIGMINPATHVINEFPVPTASSFPLDIVTGADGNLWFTEAGASQVGMIDPATDVISEFSAAAGDGITAGPDGNLWFVLRDNAIGTIDPATHAFSEFPLPASSVYIDPLDITTGPDGNLWFTENGLNQVGMINPTNHLIDSFAAPTLGSAPAGITTGPDGNLWFTEEQGNQIGQLNTSLLTTTTTALGSSANPSTFGQTVTFTATVAPTSGTATPTGTVTFSLDGTPQSPVPLGVVDGQDVATFWAPWLSLGTHTITATYAGEGTFTPSAVALPFTQSVVVSPLPATTIALGSSARTSTFPQPVTVTATVAPTSGTCTPTGMVTFSINGTPQPPVPLAVVAGQDIATFSESSFAGAVYTISATYDGDSSFAPSQATSPLTLTVNRAPTITTLSSSAGEDFMAGQEAGFLAVVSPAQGAGTPTGFMQLAGAGFPVADPISKPLETLSGGQVGAGFALTLAAGTNNVFASYLGDADYAPSSASLTVQASPVATTTTLSADPDPASFGQTVTFTAAVTSSSEELFPPNGGVTFSIDGVAQSPLEPLNVVGGQDIATFSVASEGAGTHTITASYSGDFYYASSAAAPLFQAVTPALTTTTLSSSANPATAGQSVTFTATVSPQSATGTPTGTVTFSVDGAVEAVVPLSALGGQDIATFSDLTLASGTYLITASYGGDNDDLSSSGSLSQSMSANPTTTTLTTSANPATPGQTVTFTATVIPQSATGTPTGTVTFTVDGTAQASVTPTLAGGQDIASFRYLLTGYTTVTIGATYNGDSLFAPSQAAPLSQIIAATTPVTLSASTSSLIYGQPVTFTASVMPASGTGIPTGTVTFAIDGTAQTPSQPLSVVGGEDIATLSVPLLGAGNHIISATYDGDENFPIGMAAPLTETVSQAPTTITFVGPLSTPYPYTYLAIVAGPPGAGNPTGDVWFSGQDRTHIDPIGAALSPEPGGQVGAEFTLDPEDGTNELDAYYGGDANFAGSSGSVTLTINLTATTTALSADFNPAIVGQTVTFAADVTAQGSGTPTGTVTFTIDGTPQSPSPLAVVNGQDIATFSAPGLTVGTHTITATFNGATAYDITSPFALSEAYLTQTVAIPASITTLEGPVDLAPSQPATFTAIVASATGSGTPTGTVEFYSSGGSPVLDPVYVPVMVVAGQAEASLTVAGFDAGTDSIHAIYIGDPHFAESTAIPLTVTVNSTSTPTPTPTPTPPQPPTTAGVHRSPTGLTSIDLSFGEALNAASATTLHRYRLRGAVHEHGATVFRKPVDIRSVRYDETRQTVTITLARPHRGSLQVTIEPGLVAANGASSRNAFSIIVN